MFCIAASNTAHRFANSCITTLRGNNINLCFKNVNALRNVKVNSQQIREKSFIRFFAKESVQSLKERDNVPDVFELIYRNKMSGYLRAAQIFSSICGSAVCLKLVLSNSWQITLDTDDWAQKPGSNKNDMYVYLWLFITFCVSMQFFVARMPLRIYNYPKQDEYLMIFYGPFPTMTRRLSCKAKEITKQDAGILPWTESTYEVKNKTRVILIEHYFRRPADWNIMLGYQKNPENDE